MTDLNMMMREQAKSGLQTKLDAAVTNGDTAEAQKIADQIAALAVQTAPKAPPFGDAEIRAELEKLDWFGTDPKKSAKAVELGKTMDPKKFATAAAFAERLVKAVEDEFKPAGGTGAGANEDDNDEDDTEDDESGDDGEKPATKPRRKTDGPGDADAGGRSARGRTSGPWAKLTDAPADVQKEIKRSADKFVSSNAPEETRDTFIAKALESHYAAHQRKTARK